MTGQGFEFSGHSDMPTREDVLIGRVVDGEANDADWADLERVARTDADIWKRVAHAQRAHARLERAVEDAIAVAELVDLPAYRPARGVWGRTRSGLGWAVAAALGLALVGNYQRVMPGARETIDASQVAGFGVPLHKASTDEAFNQYITSGLANGRVVGEMDPVLVEAREVEGTGGVPVREVIVVRRVVERISGANMPVFTVRTDEHGLPVPKPMDLSKPAAEKSQPVGL